MNILFDLEATQPNSSGKRHGGGKYGEVVFTRILQRHLHVYAFYDSTKWMNPNIMNLLKGSRVKLFDVSKQGLDEIIKENLIDILYTPLLSRRTEIVNNCKVIATVHGLRGLELPIDLYKLKYRHERSLLNILTTYIYAYIPKIREISQQRNVQNAAFLKENIDFVTVSNHSAFSLNTFFPSINFDVRKVFYSPSTVSEIECTTIRNNKYFLMVSGNRWEKNNLRAIIAFDKLFSNGKLAEYEVLITGAKSQETYTYKIKNTDRFKFLGYVEDEELTQLYHDAYSLVYPSLNEGFGYPPIEAMHFGIPVIASPFTSIQEVCKDAALYFNPFSIHEIMNRILMMSNSNVREEYSKIAKIRAEEVKAKQDLDLDRLVDYIYYQKL